MVFGKVDQRVKDEELSCEIALLHDGSPGNRTKFKLAEAYLLHQLKPRRRILETKS